MLTGQTLTVTCFTTPELQTAYETAKQTRREMLRKDYPHDITISCSGKTMSVVIRIMEKGENFDLTRFGHGFWGQKTATKQHKCLIASDLALEPRVGLEPTTFSLRMKCSTD